MILEKIVMDGWYPTARATRGPLRQGNTPRIS
jgi:hypothetical protein